MLSQKLFDEISNKISETIAGQPGQRPGENVKAMMAATFSRMDLVTREEFDIQQEVLAQTRAQLTALEQRLALLEGAAQPPAPTVQAAASDTAE